MLDLLKYERQSLSLGYKYICGVDEVGRGCLAGAVFFHSKKRNELLKISNDGKNVSGKNKYNFVF